MYQFQMIHIYQQVDYYNKAICKLLEKEVDLKYEIVYNKYAQKLYYLQTNFVSKEGV